MNGNTTHPQVSSEIAPTGVYDLDTLRRECKAIGIEPTRPNIRRMRRAIDLHQHGAVRPFYSDKADGYFFVHSQNDSDTCYSVLPKSGCSCPDAKRLSEDFGEADSYSAAWTRINQSAVRCKHEMAVLLWKEQRNDQAQYDQWLCDQYEQEQARSAMIHCSITTPPWISSFDLFSNTSQLLSIL